MARARNRVIAGDYGGKLVGRVGSKAYIILSLANLLYLDAEHVESLELIDEDSELSVGNAAVRGFVGEMLLGPVGLAAAVTAKRHEAYIVGIVFKDGKRSVVEVDAAAYRALRLSIFEAGR